MKGIIIYGNPMWGDNERAIYCEFINEASFELKNVYGSKEFTSCLKGEASECSKAICSPEDTYDFETGALIALMKMCGSDKVVRACNEVFSYETDIKVLRKDNNNLREANKGLQEEVKRLKGESESHWKKYQRNIQKKQDRINELNNIEEEYIKLREEYDSLFEENEKLQHEYNLCKNSENALKCSVDYLNKTIAKLNAAIHGYKEDLYKALVELFKKIPKDKVDTAYKEAYNTKLPLWQKEVLKQMYDLHKESKEKIELQGFHIEIKPSTKREEMWNDILACGDCEHSKYVKVKKEDLEMFAKECNEKKIFSIIGCEIKPQTYWSDDNSYIFQIFRKPAGFICAKMVVFVYKDTIVDYLPPMRWDLFKKGRIVVGVRNNNELVEFRKEVERNTGIKNIPMCPTNLCLFYSFDKDDYKIILQTVEKPNIAKINGHKVIYWEDVR